MKIQHILTAISIVLLPASAVMGDLMLIKGNFSSTPSGLGFQNIGEFSGSFSFHFDFDSVSGGAIEQIEGIPIFSLSVSPTSIDGIVYSPENTSATMIFRNGNLNLFWVGGATNGVPLVVSRTDDFSVEYRGSGSTFGANRAVLVTRDDTGIGLDDEPFGSATVGPIIEIITIDIKPGSDPNAINPESKGVIPVAVLGSMDFDATQVDFSTVEFGPGKASPVHDGHVENVNGDGFDDMVFHFNTQGTGITCGDTEATLSGETFGGDAFTGTDSVKTAGCK